MMLIPGLTHAFSQGVQENTEPVLHRTTDNTPFDPPSIQKWGCVGLM